MEDKLYNLSVHNIKANQIISVVKNEPISKLVKYLFTCLRQEDRNYVPFDRIYFTDENGKYVLEIYLPEDKGYEVIKDDLGLFKDDLIESTTINHYNIVYENPVEDYDGDLYYGYSESGWKKFIFQPKSFKCIDGFYTPDKFIRGAGGQTGGILFKKESDVNRYYQKIKTSRMSDWIRSSKVGPVSRKEVKQLVKIDDIAYIDKQCFEGMISYYPVEKVDSGEWVNIGESKAKLNDMKSENIINEKVEKHETLNPKLWNEDNTLKPEIKEKIDLIVKDFLDDLAEDDIKINVKDIKLVGSNCSYNYNDNSDLDIHIVADTKSLQCPDNLYPLLYSAYRSIWNKNHDISFYGIPVELYVETDDTKIEESYLGEDPDYSNFQKDWDKLQPSLIDEDKLAWRKFNKLKRELMSKYDSFIDRYSKYYNKNGNYNNSLWFNNGNNYNMWEDVQGYKDALKKYTYEDAKDNYPWKFFNTSNQRLGCFDNDYCIQQDENRLKKILGNDFNHYINDIKEIKDLEAKLQISNHMGPGSGDISHDSEEYPYKTRDKALNLFGNYLNQASKDAVKILKHKGYKVKLSEVKHPAAGVPSFGLKVNNLIDEEIEDIKNILKSEGMQVYITDKVKDITNRFGSEYDVVFAVWMPGLKNKGKKPGDDTNSWYSGNFEDDNKDDMIGEALDNDVSRVKKFIQDNFSEYHKIYGAFGGNPNLKQFPLWWSDTQKFLFPQTFFSQEYIDNVVKKTNEFIKENNLHVRLHTSEVYSTSIHDKCYRISIHKLKENEVNDEVIGESLDSDKWVIYTFDRQGSYPILPEFFQKSEDGENFLTTCDINKAEKFDNYNAAKKYLDIYSYDYLADPREWTLDKNLFIRQIKDVHKENDGMDDEFIGESYDEITPTTPYMLRNDGKLLPCGTVHPYVKMYHNSSFEENYKIFKERPTFVDWYMKNSLNDKSIKLLETFVKQGLNEEEFNELNDLLNQEFCRVRTSNFKYKTGGNNGEIYFRISSKGFNWFPLIWDVVMDNIKQINNVTILKDAQTFGKEFDYYILDGKKMNHIDVDEFINLPGNPIIEGWHIDWSDESGDRVFIKPVTEEDKESVFVRHDIYYENRLKYGGQYGKILNVVWETFDIELDSGKQTTVRSYDCKVIKPLKDKIPELEKKLQNSIDTTDVNIGED